MNNCTINYANRIITTLCWATCILSALRCLNPGTKLSWEPRHPAPSYFSEIITTMCTLVSAITVPQRAPCPQPIRVSQYQHVNKYRVLAVCPVQFNHVIHIKSLNPFNNTIRYYLIPCFIGEETESYSLRICQRPCSSYRY